MAKKKATETPAEKIQNKIKSTVAAHKVPCCKKCKGIQLQVRGITTNEKEILTTYACPQCEHKETITDLWK